GFDQWCVAGHDRGGRVAHRMALDFPQLVAKVAFLDIVPTLHMLSNIPVQWAVDSYHWFFMAQPYDYPEKMIEAYGFERYNRKKLPCGHYPAEQVPDETYAELRAFFAA